MNAVLKQSELAVKSTKLRRLTTFSAFGVAIVISLIVHAVILTIHFEPELKKLVNKLPALDVVLVNAKTKKAPEKAELLAQANLDRGGNTDANRQMKTALPAPKQKTTEVKLKPSADAHSAAKAAKLKAQEVREQKRVDVLEKQAQELLTQLNATKKVESSPTQDAASADPEQGDQKAVAKSLNRADLIAASIEIDRLEAQIAKQQEEYQKRPKRRFIGARTKEASDAMYLEAWRQKVERIGNMNYPEAARNQKIYGQLRMTVSIKSDGSIEKIEIDKSSGSKVLDEAAKNIVNLAAPYARFTEEMKRNTDILGITRTWTFTHEDELATQ